VTVVDGFNDVLGDFAYVYYQGRIRSSAYFPTILLSTYYNDGIASTVNDRRSSELPEPNSGFQDSVYSTPALIFGTNSVGGSPLNTITHSYYPI
jgi:hypothetical protein